MTGISGVQGSGAFYPNQKVDQAKRIQFENALAAARTADNQMTEPEKKDMDQVDFASVLPPTKHTAPMPGSKMIQSLNRLVQNNPQENYGGLDIRQ